MKTVQSSDGTPPEAIAQVQSGPAWEPPGELRVHAVRRRETVQ